MPTIEDIAKDKYPEKDRYGKEIEYYVGDVRDAFIAGFHHRDEEVGLMAIDLRSTKALLASCEVALSERDEQVVAKDKEIERLKGEIDYKIHIIHLLKQALKQP